MRTKIISTILLLCFVFFLLPGCIFVNKDFRHTKNIIIEELDLAEVKTNVQLKIGPTLLSAGRLIISFTDIDDETLNYLRDIYNVQVGVYELPNVDARKPLYIPQQISDRLAKLGYRTMVKAKDRDSASWVMIKMSGKRLTSMYVISLERDELVLVEIRGRLDRLVEKAIQDHGFKNKGKFLNI